MKLICLCVFRNAASYLPEFINHLHPYVDSFAFLDDRSDGDPHPCWTIIRNYAASKLACLVRRESAATYRPHAYETRNREILLREALAEGATHVLCLDADERLEKRCAEGLRDFCADNPESQLRVWVRDLWNSPTQYRVDGVWGCKQKPVLFPLIASEIGRMPNILHQTWLPSVPTVTIFNLYHLGSLTPELRAARVAKFEAIDDIPGANCCLGYNYLMDETGLTLTTIPKRQDWR